MDKIDVSIIVPVYNIQNYIEDCLCSLVNQTLDNIEIICIDDCSTDNSYGILNNYRNMYPNKIRLFRTNTNIKQGGARNIGIKYARGEYIGFVDGDDWVSINMYEKLFSKAKEDNSDIVDCDYCRAKDKNTVIQYSKSIDICQTGELDVEKRKKLILDPGKIVTKIFKKSIFIDNDIKYPENLFYEDNQIASILTICGSRISKVNESLYFYRISNISTTRSFNNDRFFDMLITSKNIINEFKKRNLYYIYNKEVDFIVIKFFYIDSIVGCISRFNPPRLDKVSYIKKEMDLILPKYKNNIYYKDYDIRTKLFIDIIENKSYLALKLLEITKYINYNSI